MRHVPRSRIAGAVCAVPAVLLALSGCAGTGTQAAKAGDTSSGVSAAPPSDTRVSTDAPVGRATTAPPLDEQTLVPAMKAAMERQRTAHVSMTTDAGGASVRAEGEVAFRGRQQDMVLRMDGKAMGTGDVQIRMVDKVLYLSMPPMTPKGKFVEVRPGDKSSPFAGMVGEMKGADPRETFTAFEDGLRKVTYVGKESVHGEDLQHYRLLVDFRSVAKAQGMPASMAGMPRTVTYDMWLDDHALMRRMQFDLAQQVSMVVEMSRWGEPVSITAPPRSDLVKPRQP